MVTVKDSSNGLAISGAFVQVTLSGSSSWGGHVPDASGSGVTDTNGQFNVGLSESPNGWAGDCWKYAGSGSVSADGYATTPFSVSTGCITGDVSQDVNLNKVVGASSSAGSSASSGQAALAFPTIDLTSFIVPVAVIGAVGVAGYVGYRMYKRRRRRREMTGMSLAAGPAVAERRALPPPPSLRSSIRRSARHVAARGAAYIAAI